ncbi:MAG: hypothetical protein GWO79_00805 [Actinobacteria bacterium]|nr:hypothetical protein [Actinomycetota bacterium]
MDIIIDLTQISEFFNQPAYVIFGRLFYIVGWIPVAVVLLWGFKELWIFYIQNKWGATQNYIFLAIDIPRGNEQSPKAVENMFSYLAGAHGTLNLVERFWEGKFQLAFSFEIVSIEGYTQFLVRAPAQARDLVESAFYAQYPDAEITEVNDYTEGMPTKFPDDEYDVWGADFIQVKNSAYPIKTYEEFEHQMGDPKLTFRDPMASLMDLTSSLKKGEQLWYQIILVPTGFEWPEMGEKEISKILKEKVKAKNNIADWIINSVMGMLEAFSEGVYKMWGDIEDKEKKEEDDSLKMMNLKPREKKQIEAIQNKVSKVGYETKIRFVYIAKKDVMNKPKVTSGFVGYIKQFASMDLNNIKPDMDVTATSTSYFFKEKRLNWKKSAIVRNYMSRDSAAGRKRGLLNIEELATIWHFPVESAVRAPLIQKASRRKAEPPMTLPTAVETVGEELKEPIFEEEIEADIEPKAVPVKPAFMEEETKEEGGSETVEERGAPPGNLPVI